MTSPLKLRTADRARACGEGDRRSVRRRDTEHKFPQAPLRAEGFKKILGPDIVRHVQNGTTPPGQPTLQIPDISVRIRRKDHYAPLEGLRCKRIGQNGKLVHMHFELLQGDVEFAFSLDFGAERIQFDLFSDIGVRDTGSTESPSASMR